MRKLGSRGELNILLIPLILVVLLLFGAGGFGYWAYTGRQDYKDNVDQKINAAVAIAVQNESTTKDKEFAQKEKFPLTTYTGPEAFGTIKVQYPKTWSAYIPTQADSGTPIDGYFYPGVVPDTTNQNTAFALRVQVTTDSYDSVLQNYESAVQTNTVTVKPYALPNVPKVVGVRVEGAIQPQKQGSMIVLPLRNETLEIWTESGAFEDDFNNIILKNFTFSP
jgi:hypothetical protein